MSIDEFARHALQSDKPVGIAGRCTVFAESDMIHKQQMGHKIENIIYGLCQALVRNYLNDVSSGKNIQPPIVFQGGVAFNKGIVRALEEELGMEIIVPQHHELMGAIGAALLLHEEMANNYTDSMFKGFDMGEAGYLTSSFECKACPSLCDIAQISVDGKVLARWGGRCDLYETVPVAK